jgi:diacylglycerol kinase (ATP)
MAAPFQRALVVANPIAGHGRAEAVGRDVAEGLRRRGVAAELYLTRARGDAQARVAALQPGVDLVVAVGGDGTLREVLEGLPDREVPIGVVPFGTANVMSRDLGLPRDVDRALDVIAAKKITRVDAARVNGHLSFLVTGVGLDGLIVRDVERRRRGPITRWSYAAALARTLPRYRPPRLAVALDGVETEGEYGLVLISNIVHYAGLLRLSPDRRLDDGRFEVYLFRDARPRALASAAVRGVVARLPGGACEVRRARRVRITSDAPVPYQVDGDYGGETPVDFTVCDRQYPLLTP